MSPTRSRVIVRLDVEEARVVESVGLARHFRNVYVAPREPRADAFGDAWDGRDQHVLGAFGEYVLAKVTGLHWPMVVENPWRLAGDVGRVQVRTRSRRDGYAYVRYRAVPTTAYVHVARLGPLAYEVLGWLLGEDAMQPRYAYKPADARDAAWRIPTSDLYHLDELPRIEAAA